ncbi:hypothetical protein [Domibacillus indicus]|uniref:hypothetical protein n=1 Tax=Domibacillus indicus TaxID=1437523 RepID=UPI00069639DB|nr:hypothetical protein [Domibacillus indicus]
MKTSTMGMIVGSSALVSAGAVKASKGYQRKKMLMEKQNRKFSAMQEMKNGIKSGVKNGTGKTASLIKSGIETEEEMLKGGINKTIEGVKTGIEAQQKMMEKEKEVLDKVNSSIQKKEMTMGVVVGSTALLTTGIVLALNAYQQKQEAGDNGQAGSDTLKKLETGIKAGTQKVTETLKSSMNFKGGQKADDVSEKTVIETNEKEKFIADKTTELKKDEVETPDARKEEEYKGLTELDAQYRDEWQANGFPQTHAEMEKLEKEK